MTKTHNYILEANPCNHDVSITFIDTTAHILQIHDWNSDAFVYTGVRSPFQPCGEHSI